MTRRGGSRGWRPGILCGAALAVALAVGCGRYGPPVRPSPAPPAPAETPAPEAEPDPLPAEPDFRLDLPGLNESDDDE